MAVYVDPAVHPFGRMIMCHLFADSEAELMAMVDRIGVDRRWAQRPPKADWLHFDIAKGKRALAVAAGAIEVDRYAALEHAAEHDGRPLSAEMRETIARVRAAARMVLPDPAAGPLREAGVRYEDAGEGRDGENGPGDMDGPADPRNVKVRRNPFAEDAP